MSLAVPGKGVHRPSLFPSPQASPGLAREWGRDMSSSQEPSSIYLWKTPPQPGGSLSGLEVCTPGPSHLPAFILGDPRV